MPNSCRIHRQRAAKKRGERLPAAPPPPPRCAKRRPVAPPSPTAPPARISAVALNSQRAGISAVAPRRCAKQLKGREPAPLRSAAVSREADGSAEGGVASGRQLRGRLRHNGWQNGGRHRGGGASWRLAKRQTAARRAAAVDQKDLQLLNHIIAAINISKSTLTVERCDDLPQEKAQTAARSALRGEVILPRRRRHAREKGVSTTG